MMFYKGDSGGPFYTIENNKHYLIGITSYAAEKCDDGIRFANLFIRFLYICISLAVIYDFSTK